MKQIITEEYGAGTAFLQREHGFESPLDIPPPVLATDADLNNDASFL